MRALLVHAEFPITYWGFQHALRPMGRAALLPPLGLLSVAAFLPPRYELRLVDANARSPTERELRWADVVLVGGMLVQAESMRAIVRRARALGKRTVVGGPAPTTAPELFEHADVVFRGEIEGRADELARAIEASDRLVLEARGFPELELARVPRFDLLPRGRYASMAIQYSRGCPYQCEFCDVIEIFGRRPRTKSPEQVLAELGAIEATGHRGSVFFVDDNFIGNRREVRDLLPRLAAWQRARKWPFRFYTEASVNLAAHPPLMTAMTRAGFDAVFVGIETPAEGALARAGKKQNLSVDLAGAVETLSRAGLEPMAGFIVGFDDDPPDIFPRQERFIERSSIPLAMIGLLSALPGTRLTKRLEREGRLRTRSSGDQFERPNFAPVMDEAQLLAGYAGLLRSVYSRDAFYARCERHLALAPWRSERRASLEGLGDLARASWLLGVRGGSARPYRRLLARAARRGPAALEFAVVHALMGEHLVRYTDEVVLPRIEAASAAVRAESARPDPFHDHPRRVA